MPIAVERLSFRYGKKRSPFAAEALTDVSFDIADGEFVALIGKTGSGKSTLIQHLNGLIKLQTGRIAVDEIDLSARRPRLSDLRRKIGMLFQSPDCQLFADTVLNDVKFGPKNFGFDDAEATECAMAALEAVGLDPDAAKDCSPLELSGGEKRRVAIAGVLAYKPSILILDEPTAGLDPAGKKEMLDLIAGLKNDGKVRTVIMASHDMDEVARRATRALVLDGGRLAFDGSPRDFFYDADLSPYGLVAPHAASLTKALAARGLDLGSRPLTCEEFVAALIARLDARDAALGGGAA